MSLFNDFVVILLQIVSSSTAITIVLSAGVLASLNYLTTPKYTPLEPPPLPHLLPFFGHALSFVRDQRAFFEWANKKTNGQPFSMLVAGDKLYIFHRPDDVSLIFRKSSILRETRADQKNFRINILGFGELDADKIADLRDQERQIHAAHLLTGERLDQMIVRYFEELDCELDGFAAEIEQVADRSGLKRNSFELIGDILMRSTVATLFGHDSFADYPNLFADFRQFLSEHFFERMIGLPNFFARRAVRARERIKKSLENVMDGIDERGDVSGYIQDRVKKLGTLGLSPAGIVSNELDIILGSNLNSIPMTYLALLHLIIPPNNSLLTTIRTELDVMNWRNASPHQRAKLVPTSIPNLHAFVREVFRYHTTAWSAREVSETTTIELKAASRDSPPQVYELQKGAIIAMPSSLLHHDFSVHASPEIFCPKRFLSKELGGLGTPITSATLRPFGGGQSYCPGRLFAEKQIVGFLAAFVSRFDVEAVGKGKAEIPRNADFFFVTRQRDVNVLVWGRGKNGPRACLRGMGEWQ